MADPKTDDKGMVVRALDVKIEGPAKGRPTEPTVIRSPEELAKAIPDEAAVAAVKKVANFEKEHVIYFAWSGSRQDKITFTVQNGKAGPEVTFTYAPGLTRDVRPHQKLFALPKGATHTTVTAGR